MPSIPAVWEPMTSQLRQRLWAILAGLMLLMGLVGCSSIEAEIPAKVVDVAVAQQAQQAQVDLWQQLAPSDVEQTPDLSVNRVNIQKVRQVKVGADLAYEVTGTYQSKLRYPQRSPIVQKKVPFHLILEGDPNSGNWRLLQTKGSSATLQDWSWKPLLQPG